MTTPQHGIFTEGNRYQHVLEYTVKSDIQESTIKNALTRARAAVPGGVSHVIGFGPMLWARLARDKMPTGFTNFQPIKGPKAQAPATQQDIFVWLHGPSRDIVFDAAQAVHHALRDIAHITLDLPGFTYHDFRDMTGFVDGSANPKDIPARKEAALVPDGQPGAGGSFILGQRYVHDLDAFNTLPESEQEKVFGRTKPDSIEFEGDNLPPDSHVGRTDLKIDGVAQKMYRRSMPYGTPSEHGLYFLAFCCDQTRYDNILRNMFGLSGDGITDHLMSFTEAKSGSYFFAPSEEDLAALNT